MTGDDEPVLRLFHVRMSRTTAVTGRYPRVLGIVTTLSNVSHSGATW